MHSPGARSAKLRSEVSDLRFRLLGPLEAERDGVTLELGARKQRAVLALLLLDANRVVSTERLIDGLWGDAPPETAAPRCRCTSRPAQGARRGRRLASHERPGVRARRPGRAQRPRRVRQAAGRGRPREALALWRGPALADLDGEPFAAAAAGRLEELRLGVLEERIDADLALGRHGEVVPELEALVAEHPYRERFRAQLMLALYRSGRQADALAAYRSARTALVDELGIEPGEELKALERSVLDQDPALAAPPRPPSPPRPSGGAACRVGLAALLVVAGVAAASVLLGDEAAPSSSSRTRSRSSIRRRTRSWATVQVGNRPGPIAAGGGSVWAANLDGSR